MTCFLSFLDECLLFLLDIAPCITRFSDIWFSDRIDELGDKNLQKLVIDSLATFNARRHQKYAIVFSTILCMVCLLGLILVVHL